MEQIIVEQPADKIYGLPKDGGNFIVVVGTMEGNQLVLRDAKTGVEIMRADHSTPKK